MAAATTSHKPQKGSRLLNLPAELRNQIWKLAVTDHTSFTAGEPGIVRSCRQVREESRSFFYAQDFVVKLTHSSQTAIVRGLRSLDRALLDQVKSLTIITKYADYAHAKTTTIDRDIHQTATSDRVGFKQHDLKISLFGPRRLNQERVVRVYKHGQPHIKWPRRVYAGFPSSRRNRW